MLRTGKYKKRLIVAEGVQVTQKSVERAEKKEEVKEVKKDEAELAADRKKLFKQWRQF